MSASNPPGRPVCAAKRGANWEKWGWIYMRVSGVLLIVLIFGHLFVNLMVGDGVRPSTSASSAASGQPVLAGVGRADALARADPRLERHAHDRERLRLATDGPRAS